LLWGTRTDKINLPGSTPGGEGEEREGGRGGGERGRERGRREGEGEGEERGGVEPGRFILSVLVPHNMCAPKPSSS